MNIKQAKSIPIQEFLAACGHSPVKQSGSELYYYSPIRNEKTPSFHVNIEKNVWHDKGTGFGGNIIDLVMEINDCKGAVSLALSILRKQVSTDSVTPNKKVTSKVTSTIQKTNYTIEKETQITNKKLIEYIESRAIPLDIATRYLSEVHYVIDDKQYYGLSYRNSKMGYEVRNPYFKGSFGKKSYSIIKRKSENTIAVFEGVFDFLSWLTDKGITIPLHTVIILNSTSLKQSVADFLNQVQPQQVHCYLDRDDAGKETFVFFEDTLNHSLVIDCSASYKNFIDYNDYLMNTRNDA